MAKLFVLIFSLSLLFLAQADRQPSQRQSQCRIQNIDAIQPTHTLRSEAGVTEQWDQNNEQLECAGVTVIRYTIQPKGLHLPHYHNAPEVSYVVQGRGMHGVAIPGCPESYQSFQQSEQQSPYDQPGQQQQQQSPYDQPGRQQESPFERRQQHQGSRQGDLHQKVRPISRGDLVVTPVGVPKWIYNDGNTPLVIITLLDTGNNENQLDNNRRTFYLAGNPQAQGQQEGQQQEWQPGQQQGRQQGRQPGRQQGRQQETSSYNIFRHMDDQRLEETFNARQETVRKLKGQNDNRGNIVRVENELQFVRPQRMQQEEQEEQQQQQQQQQGRPNGLEESSCNMKLRVNIDNPRYSFVYNPQAGRINRINGRNLPILKLYNLNAERGVLRQNAHRAPHWNMNSHSVLYCTSGSARVQIVGNYQQPIYDGEFRQGQILVVPQNFAVMKQAGNEGFEWIAFKTNDPAMTSPLAGRDSILRAFPQDVLRNAFQMSTQEVQNLKYNRDETEIFPSSTSQSQGRAIA